MSPEPRRLLGGPLQKRASLVAGWSLGRGDPLEKETATHSSILAREIPRTEEPGGHSPCGCKESDTAQQPNNNNKERVENKAMEGYDRTFVPFKKIHTLKPNPYVMVLGGGAFGGQLGLEEVTWVEPP